MKRTAIFSKFDSSKVQNKLPKKMIQAIILDDEKHSVATLAWKLEKQLSQRECLNYLGTKYDLLYQCIGLEEASKYYFIDSEEVRFLNRVNIEF